MPATSDVPIQFFGSLLLLAGLWLGYRRWIVPHAATLDFQGRGLLMLVILTLMGGFIGGFPWWANDVRSFSWVLPPLASRMLATAGWSFAVGCVIALQRPTYRRIRLILLLLFVYLTPLAVAIILFHLNRFDPAAPITYAFFGIVGIMVIASLWYLARQPRIQPESAADTTPASPTVRGWLTVIAVITGLWGLALFATDKGPSDLIWVWPGDLLSSRLIGVMLLAIAAGSLYSLRFADVSRMMLAIITTYGVGLAIASLWNTLSGKPIKVSYLVVFGIMALVSAFLLMRERSAIPGAALEQG